MTPPSDDVLMLGMNYPPEPTGISPYTGAMARGLAHRGFVARVLTTHPHYPDWKVKPGYGQWSRNEHLDGVDVTRLKHYVPNPPKGLRRLASEASFGARLITRRWKAPEAIVVVSPALISSWLASVKAKILHRKAPLIVWVQDLYALGLSETGQAGGLVVKIMSALEGSLLRRADTIIVIHDRFATRVSQDFNVPRERIEVIRNWTHLPPAPDVDVTHARSRFGWQDGETIVLHAGNMGVKQGLGNVVDAARIAEQRGVRVRFVMLGGGSELASLKAQSAGLSTIEFMAPLDDGNFAAALASADCLLVNELPGVAEMAVPSKLTSYFSAGRPVVAATDVTGITADEIRAADAGVVVPAGQPHALLEAVTALASDESEAQRFGANGRNYRSTVLDEESAIDHFTQMLMRLIPSKNRITDAVSSTASN